MRHSRVSTALFGHLLSGRKRKKGPFKPPVFEPVESGPKGTWYRKLGGKVIVGASKVRDVRFWGALVTSAGFTVFGFFAALHPDYEIKPLWPFVLVIGTFCLGPLVFAFSLLGSVEMTFEGNTVMFSRGLYFWRRKRTFPLKAIQKVRLIPRSTTHVEVAGEGGSIARVDLRRGSGLTMELGIETAKEEFRIATDLDLDKTFYLRYVLVKMLKEARPNDHIKPRKAKV